MEKQLPKNWVELKLESLFNLYYGKGLSTKELLDEGYNVYGANGIIGKYNKYNQENSKVIISCRGANSGVMHFTNPKSFVTSNSIVLDEISEKITNKMFAFYIMQAIDKTVVITGTAQPQITIQLLKNLLFPLPPLPEQDRIVAKLDSLFAELDTIKERLANIPSLLKSFKQSVLNQAVTGKLTEEWRKGNDLENWSRLQLIDCLLEKPRNGYSPKSVDYVTEIKSMSLSATSKGKFDQTKVKYLDIKKSDLKAHLWLKKGDLLIQRSNSLDYVGTVAIYDGKDNDFIYPDIMMKLMIKDSVNKEYVYYHLSSPITKKYYRDNASGTAGNMPKINQTIVSNTPIILPGIREQQEIVKRVDALFKQADNIQAHYEALVKRIEVLPKAILAKAFKGELVPQLSADGDAKELLAEIKKLKATVSSSAVENKKKRTVKK